MAKGAKKNTHDIKNTLAQLFDYLNKDDMNKIADIFAQISRRENDAWTTKMLFKPNDPDTTLHVEMIIAAISEWASGNTAEDLSEDGPYFEAEIPPKTDTKLSPEETPEQDNADQETEDESVEERI